MNHAKKSQKKGEDTAVGPQKDLFNPEEISQQTRVALFVVSLLNFSVETKEVTEGEKTLRETRDIQQAYTDVDGRYSWNLEMVAKLATVLHIPAQFLEIYADMIPTEYSTQKSDLHDGYLTLLKSTPATPSTSVSSATSSPSKSICNIATIAKLTIFLIANGRYNARGRAYVQNMCAVMNISNKEYVQMERSVSKGLSHIQASLSKLQEAEEGGKKKHDYKRYAKIGVVSVGAGALLAFTGGLAAPAVAAALLVFGTSTAVAAAALTSATVMSSLFGSAGLGLAGYKMVKRTRGISEFVFESEDHFGSQFLLTDVIDDGDESKENEKEGTEEKYAKGGITKKVGTNTCKDTEDGKERGCRINHLSVMICVSGWMIDKEDYKKSFGIVPHKMTDEERLRRFYQIYCPQKVDRAADDIRAWKNSGCTSGAGDKQRSAEGPFLENFKHSVSSSIGNISSAVGGGNDMDEFFQNLTDIYGADPRLVESLVPPPLYPSHSSSSSCLSSNEGDDGGIKESHQSSSDDGGDEDSDLMKHILESITIAFENKKLADDRQVAAEKAQHTTLPSVKMRLHTPTTSPVKSARKKIQSKSKQSAEGMGVRNECESDDDSVLEEEERGEEAPLTLANIKLEDSSCCREGEGGNKEQGEGNQLVSDEEKAVAQGLVVGHSTDTHERLKSDFWHWNQTELSGAYELNLLRWETPMQLELGKSIEQMLKDLTEAVTTKVLQATVLAALVTAVIVPYSIMKFMDKIDNIWDIATERADTAGKMLAHVLLKRPQGSRSVTLVGHSVGARLIFACLQELYRCKQLYLEARHEACREEAAARAQEEEEKEARRHVTATKNTNKMSFSSSMMNGMKSMFDDDKAAKEREKRFQKEREKEKERNDSGEASPHTPGMDVIDCRLAACRVEGLEDFSMYDLKDADNLVQDVVLLGIPSSTNRAEWAKARAVVTGRFINGYSKNDIILALIYRYHKLAIKVAGLREIHVNGVENINFSDTVMNHTDYCLKMPDILQTINLLGAPDPANIFMHDTGNTSDGNDNGNEKGNTDTCGHQDQETASSLI